MVAPGRWFLSLQGFTTLTHHLVSSFVVLILHLEDSESSRDSYAMSSWRRDSPVERADGTLCCKAHHLEYCTRCCVDYTFMHDILNENKDTDSDDESLPALESPDEEEYHMEGTTNASARTSQQPEISGYAVVGDEQHFRFRSTQSQPSQSPLTLITRFAPPNPTDTPQTLFAESRRFIRRTNSDQILLYTDGACPSNGQPTATAGCAFVFRPSSSTSSINGTVSFPLEIEGPTGAIYQPTSNRAELRAVIAALQFRAWAGEGWNELVIATDSEYVVAGATQWVRGWVRNGWVTNKNTAVKNRDLWELLLQRIQDVGLRVLFWRIPREWNGLADHGAKAAAAKVPDTKFGPIYGVLV